MARRWENIRDYYSLCVHSSLLGKEVKQERNLYARKKKPRERERERRRKGLRNQENKIKGGKTERKQQKGEKKGNKK